MRGLFILAPLEIGARRDRVSPVSETEAKSQRELCPAAIESNVLVDTWVGSLALRRAKRASAVASSELAALTR